MKKEDRKISLRALKTFLTVKRKEKKKKTYVYYTQRRLIKRNLLFLFSFFFYFIFFSSSSLKRCILSKDSFSVTMVVAEKDEKLPLAVLFLRFMTFSTYRKEQTRREAREKFRWQLRAQFSSRGYAVRNVNSRGDYQGKRERVKND